MILGRRGALRALRITSGSPARTGIAGALSGAAHTVGHAAAGQVLPRGLYVKHTSDADLAHATPIKTGVPGVVVKPVG